MTYDEIAEIDRRYDAAFYLPLGRGRTHPEGDREMDEEKLKAASAMLAALNLYTEARENDWNLATVDEIADRAITAAKAAGIRTEPR